MFHDFDRMYCEIALFKTKRTHFYGGFLIKLNVIINCGKLHQFREKHYIKKILTQTATDAL